MDRRWSLDRGWAEVAAAISARLAELGITEQELAARSGISVATLRELQNGRTQRRRNPRLLPPISEGLDWPPERLGNILSGNATTAANMSALAADLQEFRKANAAILADVQQLRKRLEDLDAHVQSARQETKDLTDALEQLPPHPQQEK